MILFAIIGVFIFHVLRVDYYKDGDLIDTAKVITEKDFYDELNNKESIFFIEGELKTTSPVNFEEIGDKEFITINKIKSIEETRGEDVVWIDTANETKTSDYVIFLNQEIDIDDIVFYPNLESISDLLFHKYVEDEAHTVKLKYTGVPNNVKGTLLKKSNDNKQEFVFYVNSDIIESIDINRKMPLSLFIILFWTGWILISLFSYGCLTGIFNF